MGDFFGEYDKIDFSTHDIVKQMWENYSNDYESQLKTIVFDRLKEVAPNFPARYDNQLKFIKTYCTRVSHARGFTLFYKNVPFVEIVYGEISFPKITNNFEPFKIEATLFNYRYL